MAEILPELSTLSMEAQQQQFPPPKGLLDLPPEIRNKIYLILFPHFNDQDDFSNPILSRRLGPSQGGGKLICYKCHGEALLYVCKRTRKETLPIYCAAHEFIFQLWKDHKVSLSKYFDAIGEDLVAGIRRFRLNTQFLDEEERPTSGTPERITPTSLGFPMPGYIKIDLDADPNDAIVEISNTWTRKLLSTSAQEVYEIVMGLPQSEEGKFVLTKEALLRMVESVGWFGYRSEKEWEIVNERSEARRNLSYSLPMIGKPL